MNPQEYAEARELFFAAMELEAGEREGFLQSHCRDKPALLAKVQSLLEASEGPQADLPPAQECIDDPLPDRPTSPTPEAGGDRCDQWNGARPDPSSSADLLRELGLLESAGDTVGPYKLLSRLGEGGFGTVWLAERREPFVQRVALKILKAGMDTKAVVARFGQERQALAVMDHPNVAKVLDAGSTRMGRPYFVMEYVKGEPLTIFCDRRTLSIRERLELFIPVCEAVQHAHMKGIIHRDIKPSNILVGMHDSGEAGEAVRGAVAKVIDFGVAKAVSHTLTQQTLFTEQGQVMGTLEYMSPEQADLGGVDIDTRTDVYSLGVVLYELLTGALPFDGRSLRSAGLEAAKRIIRETEPPKPSTRITQMGDTAVELARQRQTDHERLASELRRELEWIPLKAMRKDRSHRYRTPTSLAEDIRNYLDGRPLQAGPESAAYRVRKFVRRYWGRVFVAGLLLVTLATGALSTSIGFARASSKAHEAELARDRERTATVELKLALDRESSSREEADKGRAEAVRAREVAEYESYVANMRLAGSWLDSGRFDRVGAVLGACPERYRNWEWRWVGAAADNSLTVLRGHERMVMTAGFSPDGTRVVTASTDGTARVWDAETGALLTTLAGHTGIVMAASFSPDGARVVTASEDKTARIWDAVTGASLHVLRGHWDQVDCARFSSDPGGTWVATGSWDNTAKVWDVGTGQVIADLRSDTGWVTCVSFSLDGLRVVTAHALGTARIWDAATGEQLVELRGHSKWIVTAMFSPDPQGTRVVTGSQDGTARVWDAATGSLQLVLRGHTDRVNCAEFSPSGTRIVTGSRDGTARVWDAVKGMLLVEIKGARGDVKTASFSPDGTRIVTAHAFEATARVWDAGTGALLTVLRGHQAHVSSAVFNSDGTRILTASEDGTSRLWDTATDLSRVELKGHKGIVTAGEFSKDGSRIVTASWDGVARVWDAAAGALLAELRGHTKALESAAFSPDGTQVVTASKDGTARIWTAATGAPVAVLKGHGGAVTAASFSPDGRQIVTASTDRSCRIWDARSGETLRVLEGHTDELTSASFSPDNEGRLIITGSRDQTARLWEAATGRLLAKLEGNAGVVQAVAFSHDGRRVVTGSEQRPPRVWDPATGELLLEFAGTIGVCTAAFSPDGTRIVMGSEGHDPCLWDAATGRQLCELHGHSLPVRAVSFSADGTRILTCSDDKTALVWDSVPFSKRLPEIDATRREVEKLGPRIKSALASGTPPDALLVRYLADIELTAEQRTAAQIVIQTLRQAATTDGMQPSSP